MNEDYATWIAASVFAVIVFFVGFNHYQEKQRKAEQRPAYFDSSTQIRK